MSKKKKKKNLVRGQKQDVLATMGHLATFGQNFVMFCCILLIYESYKSFKEQI